MSDFVWASRKNNKNGDDFDSNSDPNDNDIVREAANHIYFYSEVKRARILDLNRTLRKLEKQFVNRSNTLDTIYPDIHLHIQSFGGSVFAGFSTIGYIKNSQIPVHTIIEGCAASAATLISVTAPKRSIYANSYMLIHQLSSGLWGKYEEMKDDMKNCDRLMDMIRDIYLEHTNITKKKLDGILKHDLWFDAEECLEYGLVDEII